MTQDTKTQESRRNQVYRKVKSYSRHTPRKSKLFQQLSKIDLSKSNENDNHYLYNSHLLSKQSKAEIHHNYPTSLQIALLVVSSVFLIGLLGLVFFKRRVPRRSIPSILLDSGSSLKHMQEGLRVSIESSRSQVPVPDYILPPSPEFETFLASSTPTHEKKLLKPCSALTVVSSVSQESLGRYYR